MCDSPTTSIVSTATDSSDDSFYGENIGKIVSIEGNIGGGKTTLLGHLKEALKDNDNVIFLKEPVDDWETVKDANGTTMLEKYYADQIKYGFSFQMMVLISRIALLRQARLDNPHAVLITERSLYTDGKVFAKMLAESGKMEDTSYQIYLNYFNNYVSESPVTQIVYVRTDPDICHERITKRSRTGEDVIPLGYLQECHRYHEAMLDKKSTECVCTDQLLINGNIDIFQDDKALHTMIENVKNYIGISNRN